MTQDFKIEKELLAVSFGTSYPDSRRLTIGAIEERLAQAFPDFEVRRAFTSQMIIERIKEKEGEAIDNVREALKAAGDSANACVKWPGVPGSGKRSGQV